MANEYLNFPEIEAPNPEERFKRFISAPINVNSFKPFVFSPFEGSKNEKDYSFDPENNFDLSNGQSHLGTPIYDQIILGSEDNNNAEQNEGFTFFDNDLKRNRTIDPVTINNGLITVRQGRNIVKTQLINASGTIKEYVSDNDFEITIIGAIEHEDAETARLSTNDRPDNEIKAFLDMCRVQTEIPVASPYLNQVFGITRIVIEGYEMGQRSGGRSLQFFSLTCISDTAKIIRQNREDITE